MEQPLPAERHRRIQELLRERRVVGRDRVAALDRHLGARPVRGGHALGDAAHAMSPNMAEGASLALEDALVLARMLKTHGASAESLSVFSKRRRSRIRWVQGRTHRRDRVRSLPGLLRDLALRLGGTTLYRRDYQPLLEEP